MSIGLILTDTPLPLLDNLLYNPGFELNYTSWNNYGGATISTSSPIMGYKSAQIPPNGGISQIVGADWNKAKSLFCLAKTETAGLIYIECRDISNNVLARFDAYPNTPTVTAYTIQNFTPFPTNTAQIQVGAYNYGTTDLYVDNFLLKK